MVGRRRYGARALLGAAIVVGVLAGGLPGAAVADPTTPSVPGSSVYPSTEVIERSRAASSASQAQVLGIEAAMAAAEVQAEKLQQSAGRATEAYNGSVLALEAAQQAARQAKVTAADAAADVADARTDIGRLAAASYRSGGSLGELAMVLDSAGPAELIDRMSSMEVLADRADSSLDRLTVSTVVASVLQGQAESAVAASDAAVDRVSRSRDAALDALDAQQKQSATLAMRRTAMIGQLAALRHTTEALETARAQGLAEERAAAQRAARAKAAAQAAAERRAAERQTAQRRATQRAAADRAASDRAAERQSSAQPPAPRPPASSSRSDSPGRAAAPDPQPQTPVTSGSRSRGSASGGAAAVAFAQAQLGKPYEWAAVGPDTFDCSGLTMRAWAASGVSLGHYTVTQFQASRTVSIGEARPGDLVFFASDFSDPATIYHVGLYIGGEQMIEAPFTGANVKISSIYRSSLLGLGRP